MLTRLCGTAALLVLCSALPLQAQQLTFSGTLVGAPLFDAPNFGRPPVGTVGSATFPYRDFTFTAGTSGGYTFNATSSFENTLMVYLGAFNPAAPTVNALIAATSFRDPLDPTLVNTPFTLTLTSGTSYTLVVSSFFDVNAAAQMGMTLGSFVATVDCPRGICAGDVNVVPEPATVALMASGLLALGAVMVRRRRTL